MSSDAREVFDALSDIVEDNTSTEGIDLVTVYETVFESFRQDPNMTIELWELFRLSVNNTAAIVSNMVDQEIARMKEQDQI